MSDEKEKPSPFLEVLAEEERQRDRSAWAKLFASPLWDEIQRLLLEMHSKPDVRLRQPHSRAPKVPFYETNLFWGCFTSGTGIVLAVVAATTHDLRWLLWLSFVFLGMAGWTVTRRPVPTLAIVVVVGAVLYGLNSFLGSSLPVKASSVGPKDLVAGRPSSGPGVRFDAVSPVPSWTLCQGMKDEQEINCLCPRPLVYALKRLPSPPRNNYATEITTTTSREPMQRVRLFSRAPISEAVIRTTVPDDKNTSSVVFFRQDDPFSATFHTTGPKTKMVVEVETSEMLRVKCLNQEN